MGGGALPSGDCPAVCRREPALPVPPGRPQCLGRSLPLTTNSPSGKRAAAMQLRYSSDARESGWVRLEAVPRLWLGRSGGGDGSGDAWEGVGVGSGGGGASKRLFLKLRGSSLAAHPDEVRAMGGSGGR